MRDVFEFGAVVVVMGAVFAWKFFDVWIKRVDRGPVDPKRLESIEKTFG